MESALPFRAGGLPQVLQGRKIHHVQPARPGFHKHGSVVGNDPVHHFVNARLARKIGGRCLQHYAAPRLPRLEPIRPGPHGLARKRRGTDVLPFQNMFWQNGVHPGGYRPRKKLVIAHFKRIAVNDPQLLDTQKILGVRAAGGRVCRQLAGKGHVFGGQFLPVLPQYALAQGKTHAFAAVFHAPRFCGPRLRLQILVVTQRRRVDEVCHLMRGGV